MLRKPQRNAGMRTILAVLLGLSLLGAAAESRAQDQVTVQFAILDNLEQEELFRSLIGAFEAEYPHIKVELLQQFRENFEPFAVQLAGGVGPDLVAGYGRFTGLALRQRVFLDLSPLIERDGMQWLIDEFAPPAFQQFLEDGRVYGFPKYTAVGAMYYNREMFDDAGLGPPDPNWNWTDFAATAKRLTLTDGSEVTQYGYNLNNTWIWTYPWFYAGGVDFSDPTRVPFDTEASWETAGYLRDLVDLGHMVWRFGIFAQRQAAMTSSGSWELTWMAEQLPLEVAPMPIGPGGRATQMNNDIIGINKDSNHVEEAWTLLKWLYGDDAQEAYLRLTGLQPARMTFGADWIAAITGIIQGQNRKVPDGVDVFIQATAYAVPQPMFSNPQVINDHVMLALNKVIRAGLPPEIVFPETARVANAFLQEDASK